MTAPVVHLRVHSDFSLGMGVSDIKALVGQAKKNGQPALALTDVQNLHGALKMSKEAPKAGIQPIIGCDLDVVVGKDNVGSILLLAQSEEGYANICRIANMTWELDRRPTGSLDGRALGQLAEARKKGELKGVIAIGGTGGNSFVGRAFETELAPAEIRQLVTFVSRQFTDNFFIEICRNGHPEPDEVRREKAVLQLAIDLNLPIVGTTDIRYASPDRHDAFEIVQAVSKEERDLVVATNDGIEHKTQRRYHVRSSDEMHSLFSDLPEALENTLVIARRCAFKAKGRKPILPPFQTEGGRTEAEELRAQAREGLEKRFEAGIIDPARFDEYRERLEYELGIIERMGFPGYFLIVSDFIKWAKSQDIPIGPGRGSGAGSLVAYSLTITDIDPLPFGLLFERFLNPERVSMPDFDIDMCQDRREEIVRYVTNKYGSAKVAQIQTFMEIKSKTAIRDVARVLSTDEGVLPQMAINEFAGLIPQITQAEAADLKSSMELSQQFRDAVHGSTAIRAIYENALKIEHITRGTSVHAAGIVIGGDTLHKFVPVGADTKTGMPVVQFDMKDTEDAGMVKFDFLGLKTLSIVKEAIKHVKETTGRDIDISTLPFDDAETYAMLAKGYSSGVFQLESEGMKKVLRDIKPTRIEDLIAVVSLYRPGPMDMIPTYARRKNGLEEPQYPEPADQTKRFLGETFGIMVYQEQVMQVAQVVAGYTLGGADLLRRAMGKKIKSEMDAQKEQFIKGAEANGTPPQKASELFDLIEKFSGYGFNKSHAAAYAAIAYHTAYLKCHYPAQFFAALMSYEDKPEKLAGFKHDMDTGHVKVELLPPDVNMSDIRFKPERLEDGTFGVRFGLAAVKLVTASAEGFVKSRSDGGKFKDLRDFHTRAGSHFSSQQLMKLAESGALDSIDEYKNRYKAYTALNFLAKEEKKKKDNATGDMFGGQSEITIPSKVFDNKEEWHDLDEREFNSVGFFFRSHPLDSRQEKLMRAGGIRKRARIIEYMQSRRESDASNVKLLGMVEFFEPHKTWPNGDPRIEFKLAEREDLYFVALSNRRRGHSQTVDEIKNILTNARKDRAPVVVVGDIIQNDRGFRIYAQAVYLADDYAIKCGAVGNYELTIDWSKLPFKREERTVYQDISEQASKEGADLNQCKRRLSEIAMPHFKRAVDLLQERLTPCRSDERGASGIRIVALIKLGHAEWQLMLTDVIEGRYLIDNAIRNDLGSLEYLVSIHEDDKDLAGAPAQAPMLKSA